MIENDTLKIKGKTAIIVIHGIGEQNPYETLDQFGRGLYETFTHGSTAYDFHIANRLRKPFDFKKWFEENPLPTYALRHELIKFENNKGDKWIDNFLRITPSDGDAFFSSQIK